MPSTRIVTVSPSGSPARRPAEIAARISAKMTWIFKRLNTINTRTEIMTGLNNISIFPASSSINVKNDETISLFYQTKMNVSTKINNENVLQITRSEEHTSELQSRFDLVCRLLL